MIADLVLGRRQHPLLDVGILSIERDSEIISRNGNEIHAQRARFSFVVENLSLASAEDVKIGVVLWSLATEAVRDINSHLRSYLDIFEVDIPPSLNVQLHLAHCLSGSSGKKFNLDPFQTLPLQNIGPFYFHRQMGRRVFGAMYVISKDAPPTWFQLEFPNLHTSLGTEIIIRKRPERPKVAWLAE